MATRTNTIRFAFVYTAWLLTSQQAHAGIPVTYYDTATTVSGPALKASLNDIVTAGFVQVGYDNSNTALKVTDEDPANSNNVIMIYGADSRPKSGSSGASDGSAITGGWNREHSFPQSFFNENEPMRSDLHALFPCDTDTNTQRSNHAYDVISLPTYPPPYYTDAFGNRDCNSPSGFEPANVDKGRVARAILYMDIRYEGEGGNPNLTVINAQPAGTGAGQMAFVNTLLTWHRLFPPTAFERVRNQKAYNRQGNGNPIVDHPEWASLIFGGTAWSMSNGDTISVTSTNRAPATATAGAQNVSLLSLNLNLAANQFHIQQIGITNQGTATDAEVSAVKLWYDVDNNGVATNVDTLLDSSTFSGGATTFTLSAHPFYVAPGNTNLLITGSVSGAAVTGRTVILRANANSIVPDASGGNDTAPVYGNQTASTLTVSGGVTNSDSIAVTGSSRAPLSAFPGTADVSMLSVTLNMASGAEWDLGQISLSELGTAPDSAITAVRLYHDANVNGSVDGSETLLASGTFSGGAAMLVLSSPFRVTPGVKNFVVAMTVNPSASVNSTIQIRANANGIVHSVSGGTDSDPAFANIDSGIVTLLAPTGNSNIIISEVFEGSAGNLKYVELTNISATTISLTSPQLRLRRYANGSLTATNITLTGSIGPNGFFVVVNNSADFDTAFTTGTRHQISGNISHNGNDVYDLQETVSGNILDTFGGDLSGTSADFATNVVAFRILDQLPNNGAWGTPAPNPAPADLVASPSGYWVVRTVTGTVAGGNASAVGTPGFGRVGGGGQEVPVSVSMFTAE